MKRYLKSASFLMIGLAILCAIALPVATALAGVVSGVGVAVLSVPHATPLVMAVVNTLGNYNETFFAQEALIQLEKVLGLAGRIYRGYEPDPHTKGDTIQIRRPSTFTSQSAPSAAQNITTESVALTLNKWDEVKFKLTDKDLSLTSDRIVSDHIRPAAVALADKLDQNLAALYKKIPWKTTMSATPALADITAIRKVMFDNNVPLRDQTMLNFMIGGAEEAAFLNAMSAAGFVAGIQDKSLREGSMGRMFGYDVWANQNTPTHTSGVAADFTGTVDGVNAVGVSTILISGVTAGITVKEGDTFSIAGQTQRYAISADATDADGNAFSISFTPTLKVATAGAEVITIHLGGASKNQNLAFHRNFAALATAPLSEMGAQLGAKMATVSDPITGLSLRSRMFYDGDASEVFVALDILYGYVVLDPNLAVRGYAA